MVSLWNSFFILSTKYIIFHRHSLYSFLLKSKCRSSCACRRNKSPLTEGRTEFGRKMQNPLVKSLIVLAFVDFDLQCQIQIKKIHGAPVWTPNHSSYYLDCFMVLTVLRSQSSAHTYLPRLLDGLDCFVVSTVYMRCVSLSSLTIWCHQHIWTAEGTSSFNVVLVVNLLGMIFCWE